MTNAEITNSEEAIQRINNYTQRWKIERFHYVLKSGCGIGKKQERSYERLCLVTLIYSLIAMKILNFTYIGRLFSDMPCGLCLEEEEWKVLYCIANQTKEYPKKPYTLNQAIKLTSKLNKNRLEDIGFLTELFIMTICNNIFDGNESEIDKIFSDSVECYDERQ